ncbi:MAG: 4Fe-4S binding protein [Thermodesulfobacteriota bacterium]
MDDAIYQKAREFLDGFPLGLPATPSGLEIQILRRLFTPEEARIVPHLSFVPEEPAAIAARAGADPGLMAELLLAMSRKGLVFRVRREGKTLYNAAPFMIGLYEYSVKKMDAELARLFAEYYETAYQEEMGKSRVPGFRVVPLAAALQADTGVLPYAALEDAVRQSRRISVAPCICRRESELTGHGCGKLSEACLSFGAAAEYYIENEMGREIGAEEALAILAEADRQGLVHAGVNTEHLSNICNCCPCCCASMKGITEKNHPRSWYLNALFEAAVDPEKCSACGLCLDRCPVSAISLSDFASVDRDLCLGCGLCAGTCPEQAVTISCRPDRSPPFARVLDMGLAILAGKQCGGLPTK